MGVYCVYFTAINPTTINPVHSVQPQTQEPLPSSFSSKLVEAYGSALLENLIHEGQWLVNHHALHILTQNRGSSPG